MDASSFDSASDNRAGENLSAPPRFCTACGAAARRTDARFCATCGRTLAEDYFPTDSLRASYRFERAPSSPARKPPPARATMRTFAPGRERLRASRQRARLRREVMPQRSYGGLTATARAFVTYALVPYLGILFCPGALLLGGFGFLRAGRAANPLARRDAAVSFALGLLILCAQLALWWVLYKVPEWSRRSPF